MGSVIAFINKKGGVAKSTATVNTAGVLTDKGFKVLIIDLDSQGHASQKIGFTREHQKKLPITTYDTLVDNKRLPIIKTRNDKVLDLAPANESLTQAETELNKNTLIKLHNLKKQVNEVRDDYDFILIDTPGVLEQVNTAVLLATDYILIPVVSDTDTYSSTEQTLVYVNDYLSAEDIGLKFNAKLLGLFLAQTSQSTNIHKRMMELYEEELVKNFKTVLFDSIIQNRTDIRNAAHEHETITEFDPECKAAQEYVAFTEELLSRIENS